jgi:DNA-binding NarL/FixJ family response regulator
MATILVVDDDAGIRSLLQLNLELDGHLVVTAADGAAALDRIGDGVPDVVLLDVSMPEVDGWTVLETIKATIDLEVNRIPVVMLTADATSANRLRGGIEGAITFLAKPCSIDVVRRAVAEALAGDPEPAKRRRIQQAALEELARLEKGEEERPGARPRLTRLERPAPGPAAPASVVGADARLAVLTDRQRELLEGIAATGSVRDAALGLGVSRSNVYASLRRIARKLGIGSVAEVLRLVRDGSLVGPPDPTSAHRPARRAHS